MSKKTMSEINNSIELQLTEEWARKARRSKDANTLLKEILKTVIKICSAKMGVLYLKDEAAIKLPLEKDASLIHTTNELISITWEGVPSDYVPPSQIIYDSSIEKQTKTFNEYIENHLTELVNRVKASPYIFRMVSENKLKGLIYILSTMEKKEVEDIRKMIESALAESCRILDIIVDWQLHEDLFEFNKDTILLQSLEPVNIMRNILKDAKKFIGCSGISFFAKEPIVDDWYYKLVGTYPKHMPKNQIKYKLTDMNFITLVIKSKTPCIVQYKNLNRNDLEYLADSKWRDVKNGEELRSVIIIPIIKDDVVKGFLKCSNKTPSFSHIYFNRIDLYRAERFAWLMMTWLINARKEERYEYTLLDISHEIKVNVSGIKSAARYLLKKLEKVKDEEILYKLAHIRESAESLLKLLPGLHKTSIIESTLEKEKKIKSGFRPYADLCKPICETYRQAAHERKLTMEILGTDQLGFIYTDIDDFKHIFQNIIDNAVKYTIKGKKITVKMQRIVHGEEYAMIHVLSESLPIREDEREEIFRPGYRTIKAREGIDFGEGRGLMIARSIARRYKGDIVFNSNKSYNIFSILIPKELFRPADVT